MIKNGWLGGLTGIKNCVRTTFDEVVVGVASEESVGKEGDYGVDGGHVQYSNAAKLALWLHSHQW